MCECYQIGGRFIAEDPSCPTHGDASKDREAVADRLTSALVVHLADLGLSDQAVLSVMARVHEIVDVALER